MNSFNFNSIPKIDLCTLPTPIQYLKRLSEHLKSVNVYIKRDDLTGVAFGGNKNRKLEFLLADALKKNADVIITEGALTSNHCLQTAACASKVGLECELVLSDASVGERITGNLLLNQILDVKIHRVKSSEERKKKMAEVADSLIKEGKTPYIIPTGGSNRIGILGYVLFLKEIADQSKNFGIDFDYLVFGTGSAGTQSGMLIGKALFYNKMKIIGVSAGDFKEEINSSIKQLLGEFQVDWNLDLQIKDSDIVVLDDYYGEGYGIPTDELIYTLKLIAKLEGIFLDPVYNGKAMVGLIDLVKKGIIPSNSNILFLHSGGGPALFAYDYVFGKKL
ncbi:MAG TPA: D-cysteine desulfhydrase family protein [candidate division Zixibacteria bacterium]|nr:D-cysteine desulfhydrase family protein [candidate division Zixibacteria bacterium]